MYLWWYAISDSSIFDRVVKVKEIGGATLKNAKTYIELKKSKQLKPMLSKTSFDKIRSYLSKSKVVTRKSSKQEIVVYCPSRKAAFKSPRRVYHRKNVKKTHNTARRFLLFKGLVN